MVLYIFFGNSTPQWAVFAQTLYGYKQQISPWYTYKRNADKWAIRYAREHVKNYGRIEKYCSHVHGKEFLEKIIFDCEVSEYERLH